ncbi:MAG: hypothetical protein JWQ02_4058 [Capsulimonas sp.]|nr:hypothetical protein [Capsulimonas sp.]
MGVSLMLALLSGCGSDDRIPDKYLIPQGYTGWIVVQYGMKNKPAIPVVNGFRVISVKPGGRVRSGITFNYVKTSSPALTGWAEDRCYYNTPQGPVLIAEQGPQQMVWAMKSGYGGGGDDGVSSVEYMFIGTQAQYQLAQKGPNADSEESEDKEEARMKKEALEEKRLKAKHN